MSLNLREGGRDSGTDGKKICRRLTLISGRCLIAAGRLKHRYCGGDSYNYPYYRHCAFTYGVFRTEEFTVEGAEHYSAQDIIDASGMTLGENLFLSDKKQGKKISNWSFRI